MIIVHAVSNENGKANGGLPGDQTGKEIREAQWYDKPWDCYIEPKDKALGKRAVEIAQRICSGNFGYSQDARWSGYQAIKANGYDTVGDFDCSSFVISCYIFAGAGLLPTGYTGNLERICEQSGLFNIFRDEKVLHDPKYAVAGGLYLKANSHVCICAEDGEYATETDDVIELPNDEVKYIGSVTAKGSVRIRTAPKTGKTLRIIHNGDSLGILTEDYDTGWLYTDYGWITNNPQYVTVRYKD